MLVAVGAFVIAVIALASAPAETELIPPTPAAAVVAQAPARHPSSSRPLTAAPASGASPVLNQQRAYPAQATRPMSKGLARSR